MEFSVTHSENLPFPLVVEARFAPHSQLVGITGPSGAGKTTLLRCLAGLEAKARVTASWHQARARVGLVFQSPLLFPHMTVKENLLLAQSYAQKPRFSFTDVVSECCCGSLLNQYPATLSGGEGQRAALARAILNAPDVLLLDEALSAMDGALRQRILAYLKTLTEQNLPVILVSHDLRDIALYADEVLVLEAGKCSYQGKVTSAGPGFAGGKTLSVLKGEYLRILPEHEVIEFSFHGQPLYVKAPAVVENGLVKMVLNATEITIDSSTVAASSAVNAVECEVVEYNPVEGGMMLVTLQRETSVINALVSQFAFSALHLQTGATVTARFDVGTA